MKKTLTGILAGLSAVLLLLGLLLGGVFLCTTSRAYYKYEYAKYGQAQNIGISDEGLMRITNSLLDYLMGKRDTLDMQAEIQGEMREVFREREKLHMVDVKNLVTLARYVMLGCFVLGIAAWVVAFLLGKKEKGGIAYVGWGYIIGSGVLLTLVGIVVVLALKDFTSVFIEFHHIFFDNDLWLLDENDMLIMMVPEAFFADCAALIAILFGIGLIATVLVSVFLILRNKKENALLKYSATDGAFYRMMEDKSDETSDEAIFDNFGLSDELEDTLSLRAEAPLTQSIPVDIPEELSVQAEDDDLTLRFEMKLDLKIEKREGGKLLLKMDPSKQPQVTLTSVPGQVNFSLEESEKREEGLQDSPKSYALEPAPSPEELLHQMDMLMKGYPQGEDEKQ